MSKKFWHKTCAYCGVPHSSQTTDHVLARVFLAKSLRQEIPKVPACQNCNQKKSVLEHYASAVLPFAGRHSDAAVRLNEDVPGRLQRNRPLHRQLQSGMHRIWIKENGIVLRTTAIPLDWQRIELLINFIARGLMYYHWQIALGKDVNVDVTALTSAGELFFTKMKQWRCAQSVSGNIGEGALIYEGRQGTDNVEISIWELSLFGGMMMANSERRTISTKFGVMTGPQRISEATSTTVESRWIICP